MRYFIVTIVFLGSQFTLLAQIYEPKFSQEYEKSILNRVLSSGQMDYHLSSDGSRLLMISDRELVLIDAINGDIIREDSFATKINQASKIATAALGGNLNVGFQEGTAWYLNERDAVLIILDYNAEKNIIKVFDLQSGKLKWETDKYRYTKSLSKQVFSSLATNAASLAPGMMLGKKQASFSPTAAGQQVFNEISKEASASPAADVWLKYMHGKKSFVLVSNEGLICLDAENGKEKWRYTEGDLTIAFHATIQESNQWLALNFEADYLKSSKKVAKVFDIETGEVLHTIEYKSSYKNNRATVIGKSLILDFTSLEIYDINSGKSLYSSIPPSTVKMGNFMTGANAQGERNTEAFTVPAIIDGNFVYTTVGRSGGRNYPNDGGWKSVIIKIDSKTGEVNWMSDKLSKGAVLLAKSDNYLISRVNRGSGNYHLEFVSDDEGKLLGETDKFDNFFGSIGSNLRFRGETGLLATKKEIISYNIAQNKEVNSFPIENKEIGQIMDLGLTNSKVLIFGNNGLNISDFTNSNNELIKTGAITFFAWNDKNSIFIENENLKIVSNLNPQESQNLPIKSSQGERILLSRNLGNFVIIRESGKIEAFGLN